MVFEGSYVAQSNGNPNYDVFHDGQRVVMIQSVNPSSSTPAPLVVVLKWFEELKRSAPVKK